MGKSDRNLFDDLSEAYLEIQEELDMVFLKHCIVYGMFIFASVLIKKD